MGTGGFGRDSVGSLLCAGPHGGGQRLEGEELRLARSVQGSGFPSWPQQCAEEPMLM